MVNVFIILKVKTDNMSEREILFRGKRVDNGEWIEGYFLPGNERQSLHPCIFVYLPETQSFECFDIDIDTLGEYTGLTDKNGTRLFEGDIVKITGFHTTAIAAVKYGSTKESTSWGWYFDDNDGHAYFLMSKAFCEDYNGIIIGNIHDTPELLKGD